MICGEEELTGMQSVTRTTPVEVVNSVSKTSVSWMYWRDEESIGAPDPGAGLSFGAIRQ
jgi:hypothetical protein